MIFTKKELELIEWELGQGKMGDNSAYDKRIDRLLAKIRDIKNT